MWYNEAMHKLIKVNRGQILNKLRDKIAPDLMDRAREDADFRAILTTEWQERGDKVCQFLEKLNKINGEANLNKVKAMPDAAKFLRGLGHGCLEWFECLPHGIDHQTACDITGVEFVVSWNELDVNHWLVYKPNQRVERGRRKNGWPKMKNGK